MNDVFAAVWLLAAAAAYLGYQQRQKTEWLLLVGVSGGLALATKWSAGWWLMGIAVWEILTNLRARMSRQIPWTLFALGVVPLVVYFASYLPMFWQGKSMIYFFQLHAQIIRYEWSGVLPHPYQSQPWQWVLNTRPVWYWHGGDNQDIYAMGNPLLSWLEAGALVYVFIQLFGQRTGRGASPLAFLVMLCVLSFGPWLAVPRSAFYYHYTPAAPLGAIFLAVWFMNFFADRSHRPLAKALLLVTLTCLVWVFWLYYPRWTGLPVSSEFSQAVYGLLPSWR
jgi:dolichyl-phosphate-mannose--protein O-mannosyl transferase